MNSEFLRIGRKVDSELKWIGYSKGPGMNDHYVAPTGPGPRRRQDYMDAEGRIAIKTVP